jgi:hypothetical protein
MKSPSQLATSPLEVIAALHHAELRNAAAEVAAAIAHAAGTSLNVISGRAELIRQDPSNALAQVTRIEEQVNKLATGLRQLVDYLAPIEAPPDEAPATRVLEEISALSVAVLGSDAKLTIKADGLGEVKINRKGSVSTLFTLVLWAARWDDAHQQGRAQNTKFDVTLSAAVADDTVVFELAVPWLPPADGWRLEHFTTRPIGIVGTDAYRMLSICGAIARGQGNKLTVEAGPNGSGVRVRYLCKTGESPR